MKVKKLLALALAGAMVASISVPAFAEGEKVGVSMPTKDLQRWNQDGANMEEQLKAGRPRYRCYRRRFPRRSSRHGC